jgi:quercetin dioxygenase-like cupin family protein
MPVVRRAESRRTETPNAVMTTLASPTQGGAAHAVWRVDMRAGQSGPPHAVDTEQVWTVLDGAAIVDLDGEPHPVEPGDTVVIPAGTARRIRTDSTTGFTAVVVAPAGMRAYAVDGAPVAPACGPDGRPAEPAWVPDGDKVIPKWVI